jgi:hypothetical protein
MLNEAKPDPVAERVARNDATFRESNEEIARVARSFEMEEEALLPVLCECADLTCTEVVQLTVREYEDVRRVPTWFINAHGHEASAQGWARVVVTFDRYAVVEKIGEAAEIVTELDPRSGDSHERS